MWYNTTIYTMQMRRPMCRHRTEGSLVNHRPYSAYRGRKSWGRRILIALAVILAVALVLAVAAAVILPNYIVYTDDGPRVVLPLFGGGDHPQTTQTPSPSPTPSQEPAVVVESATPTPTPTPTPAPMEPRREPTLGLLTFPLEELVDGSAAMELRADQGAIFDMTAADLTEVGAILDGNRNLPYSAAYLNLEWGMLEEENHQEFQDAVVEQCVQLARLGFDELVFSEAVPEGDGAALVQLYQAVKSALDEAGYKGRMSLALDQALFAQTYDETLIPTVAQTFERLYFRHTLKDKNRSALTENGFAADGYTLVTVVRGAANLNYAWAVLP